MAIRSHFPQYVDAVIGPAGRGLARTGVSPNAITTLGLLLTAGAAVLVTTGELVLGGWILVLGGLMDTFDGAVARATGRSTPFGSFYDSVSDRVSDGLILGGLAWYLRDEPRVFALAVVALIAASVTSYVRAKAEAIDLDCSVGIMERAERAILLMLALILHRWLFEPILWLLAVGGATTVVQRVHHVWCQIDRDIPDELVALTLHDRAWSRAFKAAARRFYGQRNFDGAIDDRSSAGRRAGATPDVVVDLGAPSSSEPSSSEPSLPEPSPPEPSPSEPSPPEPARSEPFRPRRSDPHPSGTGATRPLGRPSEAVSRSGEGPERLP